MKIAILGTRGIPNNNPHALAGTTKDESNEYWVLREAKLISWFSLLRTHIALLS